MSNTSSPTRTKVIKPMLFANYPKHGIIFLAGLGNTPPSHNIYVMEPKRFFIYPKKSIAHPLNNYGQKQYPSSSLD